jgi:hypothetical protein
MPRRRHGSMGGLSLRSAALASHDEEPAPGSRSSADGPTGGSCAGHAAAGLRPGVGRHQPSRVLHTQAQAQHAKSLARGRCWQYPQPLANTRPRGCHESSEQANSGYSDGPGRDDCCWALLGDDRKHPCLDPDRSFCRYLAQRRQQLEVEPKEKTRRATQSSSLALQRSWDGNLAEGFSYGPCLLVVRYFKIGRFAGC